MNEENTTPAPTETPPGEEPKPVAPESPAETPATPAVEPVAENPPEHTLTPAPEPELDTPVSAVSALADLPATETAAVTESVEPAEPVEEAKGEDTATKPAKKPRAPRTPKAAPATATVAEATASASDAAPAENKKKWYAVKVQSGREDTIKAAIERKVRIENLEEFFGKIEIPFEEVIEKKQVRVKDKKTGEYTYQEKKVTKKKKKFHGYIFAEVEFNDRILYLFRETSGVGDFLNVRGTPPVAEPMSDQEVRQMLTGEKKGATGGPGKKVVLEFEKGDRVRIKEGSFANSEGEVKAITEPKDPTDPPKITVTVTFWGRPLDVELDWYQVVKA
jgi:transcriptional antiterminator NusG